MVENTTMFEETSTSLFKKKKAGLIRVVKKSKDLSSCTCAYHGVGNDNFWENLACFVYHSAEIFTFF